METWRPIPDFPGYEVSDCGRVRSLFQRVYGQNGKHADWEIADEPQRILKGHVDNHGYHRVILRRNGQSYGRQVHALVMRAFHGPALPGFECAHNNGDATDNHLSNLRYDTTWGNAQDKRWRNDEPPEIWVPQLRQERADGATLKGLAKKYHYAPNTIYRICRGQLYTAHGGPIMPKLIRKLTGEQVIAIRRRIANGEVQARLAEEYGVSEGYITHIKSERVWKSVLETDPKL